MKAFVVIGLTMIALATTAQAQSLTAEQKKALSDKEKTCAMYLQNMENQLRQLDTKDLIRYSAQMHNFDAWKWPYFAKRCDSDKYVNLLSRYSTNMDKVHSSWH